MLLSSLNMRIAEIVHLKSSFFLYHRRCCVVYDVNRCTTHLYVLAYRCDTSSSVYCTYCCCTPVQLHIYLHTTLYSSRTQNSIKCCPRSVMCVSVGACVLSSHLSRTQLYSLGVGIIDAPTIVTQGEMFMFSLSLRDRQTDREAEKERGERKSEKRSL